MRCSDHWHYSTGTMVHCFFKFFVKNSWWKLVFFRVDCIHVCLQQANMLLLGRLLYINVCNHMPIKWSTFASVISLCGLTQVMFWNEFEQCFDSALNAPQACGSSLQTHCPLVEKHALSHSDSWQPGIPPTVAWHKEACSHDYSGWTIIFTLTLFTNI